MGLNNNSLIELGIDCDCEKTIQMYSEKKVGEANTCDCGYCLNYAENRVRIVPESLKILFNKLGIDFEKEFYISHITKLEDGNNLYEVQYYFIGSVKKGLRFQLEGLSEKVSISGDPIYRNSIAEKYLGEKMGSVGFYPKINWLLNKPEPNFP